MKKVLPLLIILFSLKISAQHYTTIASAAVSDSGCGCFKLTDDVLAQAGAFYHTHLINAHNSFDFTFRVFFGCNNNGGDGMAFVLTANPYTLGNSAEGLGYSGITGANTLAIEFDTYQNAGLGDSIWDHTAIDSGGIVDHSNSPQMPCLSNYADITDCQWHTVHVVWDASTDILYDYFDNVLRISKYIPDLVNTYLGGDSLVYWKWTGATGGTSNVQLVCTTTGINSFTTISNNLCYGDTSGSILTTVTDGIDPFQMQWSTGDTTRGIDSLASGVYQLTISDASGCVITDSFIITTPSALIASLNTIQPTPGDTDGIISVQAGGGTLPYSYLWDNSATSDTITHLGPGTYCVTIIDSFNCQVHACDTLNYPPYIAMLDSMNVWDFVTNLMPVELAHHNNPGRDYTCYYGNYLQHLVAHQDTVIGGKTYKRITPDNFPGSCLYGFIREDVAHRKVYFMDNLYRPEILLYDFTLQVGDVFTISDSIMQYAEFMPGNYQLDSIKDVMVNGVSRKEFFLNCHVCGNHTLCWLEGIGSLLNPVYLDYTYSNIFGPGLPASWYCPGYPHEMPVFVSCFHHDQLVYYDKCMVDTILTHQTPYYYMDTCAYYLMGAVNELAFLSSFTIEPNPATELAKIELTVKQGNNFDIAIADMQGKMVTPEIHLGHLNEGTYSRQLDVSLLPGGFYLVACKTESGTAYKKLVISK